MTKLFIALVSVLAFAACDTMPNRSSSDSKSMPSSSRSDAMVAPGGSTGTAGNGAAASGKAGERNGDKRGTDEGGTPGAMEESPSGMAPK